jgi:hypothetical protein
MDIRKQIEALLHANINLIQNGKIKLVVEKDHIKVELETSLNGTILTVRAVDLGIKPTMRQRFDTEKLQKCLDKLSNISLDFNIQQRPDEVLLWADLTMCTEDDFLGMVDLLMKASQYIFLCYVSAFTVENAVHNIKKL